MVLDGPFGAVQLAGDCLIGKILHQQIQYLPLTPRETVRIGTGTGLRTALHGVRA